MAAKFSMAGGFFDAGDHAEATERMQSAMEDLKMKNEAMEAVAAQEQAKAEAAEAAEQRRQTVAKKTNKSKANEKNQQQNNEDEESDDDEDFYMNDPELERLRKQRLASLKKEHTERLQNVAKGHGEYREIVQDEFLTEVTSSDYVLVHFYHRDFEKCKVMHMHLGKIAKSHLETKFLKIDAEKAPFFVEKLKIRVLPTVIGFHNGVACNDRVVGFQNLTDGLTFGNESEFPTSALVRRLVEMEMILHGDDADEDDVIQKSPNPAAVRSSNLCTTYDEYE